jgi:putative drug exporter of the RND superfamily
VADQHTSEGPRRGAEPVARQGRLERLADFAFRRRRAVVLGWIVVLLAAFAASGALAGEFSADYATPGSESKRAGDLLEQRFPARSADTVDVVWGAREGVGATGVRRRTSTLLAAAARLDGIGDAAPTEVSRDGTIAVARLSLTEKPDNVPTATGKSLISLADAASRDGLRVEMGGQVIASAQESQLSSEAVGLAIAALVLLVTFGTLVAAGLPIATALFGLGVSSAMIGLLAAVMDVPDWSTAVASMIGLGVGIDYALLILTRHRTALAAGREPRAATIEAIGTAGRSVLVAGTTVVISLLGLFLMGLTYLQGVALSASFAVLITMAASVTLLPALLGFAGRKIDRLRIPGARRADASADPDATPAARWSRGVQRRPWTAALAAAAVLIVLATPFLGLRLGFPDAGNDRAATTTRQAYDLVAKGFGAGANGPLLLAAELRGPDDRAELAALAAQLRREPGVAAVAPAVVNPAHDTAVLSVTPTTSPQSTRTADLIRHLRAGVLPGAGLPVSVGGTTASFVDQGDATADRLPLFIGGVVALSFLLLTFTFRSVAVALKAGVMNLLSIGAAYGVVAYLAEGGWAGQLVGIDTPTPVPPFIPVIMFAILFGLSMDYEVFLLSRVREEFLAGRSTSRAVTEGLARTARVITAAALIMVAVFGAFALSPEVFLKLIGIGMAAAILIDATIVRMVLVPAVMQLLGDRNWWLPRWLARLIPERAPMPQTA